MDINERLRELGIYDSVDFFNKRRPQSAQDDVCINEPVHEKTNILGS